MIILGIDPGYDRLGIAVIEKSQRQKEVLLYSDCFQTSPKDSFYVRLKQVGNEVKKIIEEYNPDAMALETLFITKNQKTAMRVSEARGAIIYEATLHDVAIFEYSPPQIKMAVTGHGGSDKEHIIKMIPLLLKLPPEMRTKKVLDDEYDAIAAALTCAATEARSFPQKQ